MDRMTEETQNESSAAAKREREAAEIHQPDYEADDETEDEGE